MGSFSLLQSVEQLQRSFIEYSSGLFREGFLDGQFGQLQMLQDESNPDFVEQQNVDFKKIDAHVHQLKGSSSSIGAQRVKNTCIAFRSFCEEQKVEGCLRCLQQVKQEYLLVKAKLEALLRLEQQIVAAGGVIPMLNEFC
ncbi:histidine-containing phosphotransmitter 1 [Perilla frutescens var. hirtella]|uniref:Histidine-containing phosphotransfer protein n=1 Tax=Perilla frutescens var. hirtella TaxID=608512 RepID=A0AAD4JGG5_PERFH|nr:histidine-containing phosphotransmitter 1 [Perilla frutescens var. hirtella]